MNKEEVRSEFFVIIENYTQNLEEEFKNLWNTWDIKLSEKEKHQVIGGLIARQISIGNHSLMCSTQWTNEMAPIILRSMSDLYISLAWILKDPFLRSKKFIYYGLGRAKLENEHRKAQLKNDGVNLEEDPLVQATESWINSQRFDFLTTVDVGSWSEISIRKMAEEADCLDFYNYVYQPFSSAAHSTWNHVGRHNVCKSTNPLHDYLLVPHIVKPEPNTVYIDIIAKYIEKCFHIFHKTFGTPRLIANSYLALQNELDELYKTHSE
ncbi:MAG: hypothetical protein HKN39_02465 [Flavobacteriales bacterium]|nr:hypothetical protein [Flavobacteriales bacterium]